MEEHLQVVPFKIEIIKS
ncbi:hypothetical protein Gohar_028347 [Gossypium harknessii]|uniref:Uncharacterized protein n=1 Tax=Gossypium harknessii TaxID=34285 RepID=A0A7J9I690_9ROSI|nr:hypothetical protein [Gossypium harknessii]